MTMSSPFISNSGNRAGTCLLAFLLTTSLLLPPSMFARQENAGRIRVDVNLVLVEATVKDKSGRVMDGLAQSDFEVSEDGVPQTISHFSRDQLPLAVALVVDLSGSIEPFLRPLHYATQTALRTLKPEDEVALFTFSSSVERRVDLTRDKRLVADQMDSLSAGGSTDINDALDEAARYLEEQRPSARRVIILVSDNVPSGRTSIGSRDVEDAILQADAALYSLKIPGRNPLSAKLDARFSGLINVAKAAAQTGGEVFDVEKEGSLFLAFQALIERLKTRYTLGYVPTHTVRDGRFHSLKVRLTSSHGRDGKNYVILAKRGYFAIAPRAAAQ
jgi:VWFA-related protein